MKNNDLIYDEYRTSPPNPKEFFIKITSQKTGKYVSAKVELSGITEYERMSMLVRQGLRETMEKEEKK